MNAMKGYGMKSVLLTAALALLGACAREPVETQHGVDEPEAEHPWSRWDHVPQDEDFFPFGVWAQEPRDAEAYRELGVDYYFGLHGGPTAEQVEEMRRHEMPFIGRFNDYAKEHLLEDPLAWGWMHRDEPDLAHVYPRNLLKGPEGEEILKKHWPEVYEELEREGREYDGWGMGANPVDLQEDYRRWRELDPLDRPVFLQLSRAVSTEGKEMGRGDHSGNVEVYPGYFKASDIISFDNYPVAYGEADKLWLIPKGLDQLKAWGSGDRPLMVILEAGFGEEWADKHQQRAQAWMAINHGASSITWFCHRWAERNGERQLVSTRMPLSEPAVGEAIRDIMAEIKSLGAVINSPPQNHLAAAEGQELNLGARIYGSAGYVFAVEMDGAEGEAWITFEGLGDAEVEVIGEERTVRAEGGRFRDHFDPWQVRLYRFPLP